MAKIGSKSQLGIVLSKLKVFTKADARKEQYPTDSEIAADMLWNAQMRGDIEEDKTIVADFGAGTGILGIGALLVGAKKVYFIEKDPSVISILKENLDYITKTYEEIGESEVINSDIIDFPTKTDLIIMNPPFGTREKHADKNFLSKAFELSNIIYSFHKASTKDFVVKFSKDNGFNNTDYFEYNFTLKASMKHHTKRIERIKVDVFRLEKE